MEATTTRVEAIATRVEAIATRVEAKSTRVEANPTRVEAIATRVEANPTRVEAHSNVFECNEVPSHQKMQNEMAKARRNIDWAALTSSKDITAMPLVRLGSREPSGCDVCRTHWCLRTRKSS